MNAFFSRPIEEQNFNASPSDNEDLAKAAIEAMLEIPMNMRKFESDDGNIIDWSCVCNYCGGHKFAYQAVIKKALLDK